MNKVELYENALKQLAEQGNDQAKMVLSIGQACPSASTEALSCAIGNIREAIDCLTQALYHNGCSWSGKTDDSIQSAVTRLTSALRYVAGG